MLDPRSRSVRGRCTRVPRVCWTLNVRRGEGTLSLFCVLWPAEGLMFLRDVLLALGTTVPPTPGSEIAFHRGRQPPKC
eukprot:2817994-Pyramimonas_sp.AAC.1